ncbi:MAG: ATP-binding protein [Verrucomicrobia bacterium]|nr:ATP-binding protein [Verrucomicrobiota bacterium]
MFRTIFACISILTFIPIWAETPSHFEEVKEKIVASLSQTFTGKSQAQPLLILLGGHVGSGKTTLSKIIAEKYGMTVFSLNSIRQAMLSEGIDIRSNKQEERKILFEVYPRLLAPCIAQQQHIVIDANANRQGIQDALRFLQEHQGGKAYRVIKIHLKTSEEELHQRVRARVQQAGLHQGTEADLDHELRTPSKAIYPDDYDLVIDTENTPLEKEIQMVGSFLEKFLK